MHGKMYNEIQWTKSKMYINNRKMKYHLPCRTAAHSVLQRRQLLLRFIQLFFDCVLNQCLDQVAESTATAYTGCCVACSTTWIWQSTRDETNAPPAWRNTIDWNNIVINTNFNIYSHELPYILSWSREVKKMRLKAHGHIHNTHAL